MGNYMWNVSLFLAVFELYWNQLVDTTYGNEKCMNWAHVKLFRFICFLTVMNMKNEKLYISGCG
jgi:hypothetical protein